MWFASQSIENLPADNPYVTGGIAITLLAAIIRFAFQQRGVNQDQRREGDQDAVWRSLVAELRAEKAELRSENDRLRTLLDEARRGATEANDALRDTLIELRQERDR